MTPKLSIVRPPIGRTEISSGSEAAAAATSEPPPPPAWWLGRREEFAQLVDIRVRIHDHERAAAKKAQTILGAMLLAAVSVHSMDAMGAVSVPAGPGFLALFVAAAVLGMLIWLLDRRLLQQLSDINLRSKLWLDLVDAVKHDRVDIAALAIEPANEKDIERLLRKEAAIAARFLTSGNTLAPHLPIFGHCFTLESN
jgi:hypothetical protein